VKMNYMQYILPVALSLAAP